jgi:uncharacterized membrane protein
MQYIRLISKIMLVAGFFTNIMPPYLPLHLELVYLSGLIELLLGVL